MSKILILLPGTYYDHVDYYKEYSSVYIVEHPEFFLRHNYSLQNLVFRRFVGQTLANLHDYNFVSFSLYHDFLVDIRKMTGEIFFYDPSSWPVSNEFLEMGFKELPSLGFFFDKTDFDKKKYFTNYALTTEAKKRMNMEAPSADKMCRERLTEDPAVARKSKTIRVPEDIARLFLKTGQNGQKKDIDMYFGTTRKEALSDLNHFFKETLQNFCQFQDSITEVNPFLYHSCISPYLNIGLLVINDIIARIKGLDPEDKNVEAFFRQIFGWREYMRQIWYLGPRDHSGSIGSWDDFHAGSLSKTYIRKDYKEKMPPNDLVNHFIEMAHEYGHIHHIIRLMVIGSWAYMNRVDPIIVFDLFMGLTIDAYPWVMYGNVLYMSQFVWGRVYTHKDYYSSSVYLRGQMSPGLRETYAKSLEDFDNVYKKFNKID